MPKLTCHRCGEVWSTGSLGSKICPRCLLGLGLAESEDTQESTVEAAPPGSADLEVIGHYVVLSTLGQGGAGRVFLAEDRDIPGRRVALKILKSAGALPSIEKMRHEASALAALQHPHILVVHEIGNCPHGPFLVTEYLPGGTLADRLGPELSLSSALRYAREVAGALALAHVRGIVHRDVKPANLLFTEDGTLKVADFGLALTTAEPGSAGADAAPNLVSWSGTPGYVAPEVLGGAAPGPSADQFAFGVTLHEMLAGSKPFSHSDWRDATLAGRVRLDPSIPGDLAAIVRRSIAIDPADRYRSMEQIVEALDRAIRRRDPSRRRAILLAAAGLVAVFAVVAIWQGGRLSQTRRARSLHAEGIRALDENRREDALQAFLAARSADPGFLPACVALGKLVPESIALTYLRDCHAAFPDSSRVSYNLGQALALRGETEQAESVLREALEKNDDPVLAPMLLNELALVTIDLGRPDEAFAMLDSATLPPPDTVEGAVLQKTLGLALLESDRPADATGPFRQALAGPLSDVTRANALVGLGRALERQGDAGAARKAYAQALLSRPDAEAESAAREGLRRLQESAGASGP